MPIRTDKPRVCGVIVAAVAIVEARFAVVVVSTVAEAELFLIQVIEAFRLFLLLLLQHFFLRLHGKPRRRKHE